MGGHRAAPYKGWSLFAASGNAVKVWDDVGKRSGRSRYRRERLTFLFGDLFDQIDDLAPQLASLMPMTPGQGEPSEVARKSET